MDTTNQAVGREQLFGHGHVYQPEQRRSEAS